MTEFFRFPHTPHIAWLGENAPRNDKVLSVAEANALLSAEVIVEEKLDGANVGISLAPGGYLRAQNRGQYLIEPISGQFSRLPAWLEQHGSAIRSVISQDLILFGEWCAARHSLHYSALPDWFLLFDVFDRGAGRFWSTNRRDSLASTAGMKVVPQLASGKFTIPALESLVESTPSRFSTGPIEGVVVRRQSANWCEARAKLVRSEFTQAIDGHWRGRTIEWNRLEAVGSPPA